MDDEFKLCWKNFQDNIASGFQNLYDRGDLVDVTLACDGKLLHAHKIVLAICSPYFQEIFITNPCKHPIIILKDVHFNIMCELLEFMYQGVVNVKHTELQSFMKIGQLLHIKGLATNSSAASTLTEKEANKKETPSEVVANICTDTMNSTNSVNETNKCERDINNATNTAKGAEVRLVTSPASSPSPMTNQQQIKDNFALHDFQSSANLKRQAETDSDTQSFYTKKQFRRTDSRTDQNSDQTDENDRGLEHVSSEDFFLSAIPHISMVDSRYDYSSVKREGDHSDNSAASSSIRNSFPSNFGFDYNLYKNSSDPNVGSEFSNDLHLANDCMKNFGNHMDIPSIAPGEHWFQGKLEFMLSQRGKPLLVHDGHTFGIQYVRKDKKYWQCNLSRKFNCKARVTTTDTGEIIVTNNEHCHTEIRQHLRKDYQRNKVMMNALINLSSNRYSENLRRQSVNSISSSLNNIHNLSALVHNSIVDAPQLNLQSNKMEHTRRSLEMICGSEPASSVANMDGLKPSNMPKDIEPLDCGMKTLTNEALNR